MIHIFLFNTFRNNVCKYPSALLQIFMYICVYCVHVLVVLCNKELRRLAIFENFYPPHEKKYIYPSNFASYVDFYYLTFPVSEASRI